MRQTLHQSHPIFDIEDQIVKAGNQPCPVDLKPWQDKVDKIAGKTPDGKSRLRFVWGQDWERASAIICGRRRLKYPFWRYLEAGEIQDIGTPRIHLEELHTNAELQRGDRWNKARYFYDEEKGEMIDVMGPIPEEGFYTCVFVIAFHDDLCCKGREVINREPCLGAYRGPTDTDLQRIRRMKYRRDHASNDERAPSDSLLEKRTENATAARNERWRRDIRAEIEDFIKTRSHSWDTLDPGVYNWGKFHFTAAHSKSGLKKKEANNGTTDSAASTDAA